MKIIYEKQFKLSSADRIRIGKLVHLSVLNFIDKEHNTGNKRQQNSKSSDHNRLCNMLQYEAIINEKIMNKIFLMLAYVKDEINKRINLITEEYPIDSLPEKASPNSLIVRPKEMVANMLDGYRLHLMNVDEIINILKTENDNFDEEDEEDDASK